MPRLPEDEKVLIHIIRQDYAKALAAFEADPCQFNKEALEDVSGRRDRAVRSLADEDWPVKFISAIMKMSKSAVRRAIADGL